MNRRGVAPLFLGIAALIGARCSNTGVPVVGPTEEQGNPQIVAVVVDDLHRPISTATVFVYKVPDNNDSINQAPSTALLLYTSPTDSSGTCSFDKLVPGTYSLKAIDSDSAHSVVKSNILVSLLKPMHPEFKDTLVLAAPGGFHGVVARKGNVGIANQQLKDAFIQVKIGEIDRSTVTGPDGKYAFSQLPAGVYTAYYYVTDYYSAKRGQIIVRPGADTAIDSVFLLPRIIKGFSAAYDTSAAIVRFAWQKVTFEGLWYYEVDRKCLTTPSINATFTSFDTVWADTLGPIPVGTELYYVVRSIDKAFNPGLNAGPIEIIVAKKD
jgi:hypothetical protein